MIIVTSQFGDASFRPLLSFVREHRTVILEPRVSQFAVFRVLLPSLRCAMAYEV